MVSDNNQYSVTDLVQNEQQKHLKIADKVIAEHGHLIAPNGEKSNLNKQQWAQVRTPQFKAWFGDFEQTNQEPVPVTEITGAEITGATPTETRNNAKAYIEELIASLVELNGNSNIHNNRTGFDIGLTKKGVVHGFQHSGAPTVKAVAGIKSLIENAAKIATNPHEPVNENIKQVHTLVAPLSIDGELFSVKITAKEYWDGSVKLYDHQTLEMKKPSGIYESTPDKSGSILRPALGNVSIEQLLSAFNGENTKYLASKVVDANGEPLVVYHGTDNSDFDEFNTQGRGHTSGSGAWFTTSTETALTYSQITEKSKVYYAFLSVKQPFIADFKGELWNKYQEDDGSWTNSSILSASKNNGLYDGVILNNIVDQGGGNHALVKSATSIAVFHPNQIKSAIGNKGTFSKESSKIMDAANIRYVLDKSQSQNDCKSLSFSETRKAKKTILETLDKLCIDNDSGNNDNSYEEKNRILSGSSGTGFDAKALQNRDRSRASYVSQMNKIAQKPDYDMISTSKTPETGAPMVFLRNTSIISSKAGNKEVITMADGKGGKEKIASVYAVVEADELQASHNADGSKNDVYGGNNGVMALNNGRSAGIKQAYKLGNAEQYKAQLIADKSHGIDHNQIKTMKNPVLVRVFAEADVSHIKDIGTASNVSMGAELSASEQANSDASRLSDSSLSAYKGGDIASLVNRDFLRGFISDMGGVEAVGAMISKDGSVTAQGVKRIESALVSKAYSDDSILTDVTESTDGELKSLGDALKDVAGRWSVMRSYAKDGAIAKNMDITSNLTEALQLVMKSRREGVKIGELLAQNDIFTGSTVHPITESLVKLMFSGGNMSRIRSSEVIKKALHGFLDQAMNSSDGADMFGDTASPEPLISQQQDKLNQDDNLKKSQTSMFDSVISNYFGSFMTFFEQRAYKKHVLMI